MWFYRLVNFLARIVFFSVYPRKIIGRENSRGPEGAGCVQPPSLLRHLQHYACFRRRVTFMAKKELYDSKFWGICSASTLLSR